MVTTIYERMAFHLSSDGDARQTGGQPASKATVLIVEDDLRTLHLEEFILEEEGCTIHMAGSGEEALEILEHTQPSLVLLDVGLPGMDGFTACQRIREISEVPIIIVSGQNSEQDVVRGLAVGADDYVTKPFSPNILAARVNAVIRRSKGRKNWDTPQLTTVMAAEPVQPATATSPAAGKKWDSALEPGGEPAAPRTPEPARFAPEPDTKVVAYAALPQPAPAASSGSPAGSKLYEGNMRLQVVSGGNLQQMMNFVDSIRQRPEFRLLRMVANQRKEAVDLWLGLREPTPLLDLLQRIDGVSQASMLNAAPGKDDEPLIQVCLAG